MKMWADHLTYNTDEETGKFYDVIGETRPHIVAKPGMLTTNNPFHFEGEWAERIGEKYILHSGFITNCKMPQPWWRMRGKTFDLSLIHISEPTRLGMISYAVFCLKKK